MDEINLLLNLNLDVINGCNKIVELNDSVIVPKDTLKKLVTRMENLIADVKSLHGNMSELQNKKTTLAEFSEEFEKLVKESENILLR